MIHPDVQEPPLWHVFERQVFEKASSLQLNPISAMDKSEVRAKRKMILGTMTMMTVFTFLVAAATMFEQYRSAGNVSASFSREKSVIGTVQEVDRKGSFFTVRVTETRNTDIAGSGIVTWTVFLPPGTDFAGDSSGLQPCFAVRDIRGNLSRPAPARCGSIIIPGNTVLFDYVTRSAEHATMVANTLIGQVGR